MKNRAKFVFLVLSALSLGFSGCGKTVSADTFIRTTQFTDEQGGCPNGGVKIEVLLDGRVDERQTAYTCNGEQYPARNTKIRTTRFSDTRGNCAYGGVMIQVFVNDKVQESQTQYICNGAPGDGQGGTASHNALIATEAVEAGAVCANGGVRVDAGLDANDNGELDASEVLSSRHVCNGVSGNDGTNGKDASIQTSVFVDEEGSCKNGGVKVVVIVDGAAVEGQTQYVCNGVAGQDGKDGGHDALVVTSEEVGSNCAHGGILVNSGVDANGNGTLDDEEILSARYICNGADGENGQAGADAGIRTSKFEDEQGGCKNGGVKVEVLMNGEVQGDQTQYVCNGANGQDGHDGQNGHNALVITSDEVGNNCAHGGILVTSGVDENDNGELDDGESRSSRYICNGVDGETGQAGADANIQTEKFDGAQNGCKNGGVQVDVLVNGQVQEGKTQYICNGANGRDGQGGLNGYNALVATSTGVGDHCENGGIVVHSGLDENENDVLEEGEIRNTAYVCNGSDGAAGQNGSNAGIRTSSFVDDQGGCKNGGVKVEVLIDDEVKDDLTQYICNGANGADGHDGQNGHDALVITSEDVGTNCKHGGILVNSGVDMNDDGALDADEIRSARYICNGADGDNGHDGADASIQTTKFDGDQNGCKNGGIQIDILVGDEVQEGKTQYICNGVNGADGQDGQNGHNALVVTTDQVGSRCANGGILVNSGVDTNDDKVLDADEILGEYYVCNGENGASGQAGADASIRTTNFDGEQNGCKNGGVKIEVYIGSQLQNDLTQYICNGVDGQDGQDGQNGRNALVVTDKDDGTHCQHGGIVVKSGWDLNDDKKLTGDEILSEYPVCDGEDGASGDDGANASIQTTAFDGEQDGHCTNGGVMIEVFIGNEKQNEQTKYVCNGVNGEDGQDGQNGHNALVATTDQVGAHCENGGIYVQSGWDFDDDKELDEGEVISDYYVCNGKDGIDGDDGVNVSIQTSDFEGEQDGHCANGGVKIEILFDNVKQENLTQYVCNGADGVINP